LEDARRAASGLPPVDESKAREELQRRLDASRAALAALPPGTTAEPNDGFKHPRREQPVGEAS
ncbi:hypothetical protein, partial [Streptomyces sp. URMC 124]|uniref:hypothetical protein n=1 Tax=Streptomyces sp. URMC 124 TaxID=3423405 RepID=UPI003F1C84EA